MAGAVAAVGEFGPCGHKAHPYDGNPAPCSARRATRMTA